jgi:hypothetical protein
MGCLFLIEVCNARKQPTYTSIYLACINTVFINTAVCDEIKQTLVSINLLHNGLRNRFLYFFLKLDKPNNCREC